MSIEYVFAGLAVGGVDAAIDWYERLLGKPLDMLKISDPDGNEIQLAQLPDEGG